MKTFDPHSLLTVPRIIENHETIFDVFNVWKTLMKEKTDSEIYESQNGIYISPDCIDEVYIQILGNDKLNKSNN